MWSSFVVSAAQINDLLMEEEVVLLDVIVYFYCTYNDAKLRQVWIDTGQKLRFSCS